MKPRRWFRFSLRTFFVLLTVLGVWLGREAHHASLRKEINRLSYGTNVRVCWEAHGITFSVQPSSGWSSWSTFPNIYWQPIDTINVHRTHTRFSRPHFRWCSREEEQRIMTLVKKLPEKPTMQYW